MRTATLDADETIVLCPTCKGMGFKTCTTCYGDGRMIVDGSLYDDEEPAEGDNIVYYRVERDENLVEMELTGIHKDDEEGEHNIPLKSIVIKTGPKDLRVIGKHLLEVADYMQKSLDEGVTDDHWHFSGRVDQPDIVVIGN